MMKDEADLSKRTSRPDPYGSRLTFPVAKGTAPFFPKEALCPMCGSAKVHEPHSMAVVNLGALKMTDRATGSGGMSEDLDGFLTLSWHGAHDGGDGRDPEIHASVNVVDECRGGQADLYFCSTDCLRRFFDACVDEIELKIEKARR